MILKKGAFSDLEILEIYGQINSEEYQQDPLTQIKMLNTEKQEPPTNLKSKILIIEIPQITKQNLMEEDKIIVELIKKRRLHYHLSETKTGKKLR